MLCFIREEHLGTFDDAEIAQCCNNIVIPARERALRQFNYPAASGRTYDEYYSVNAAGRSYLVGGRQDKNTIKKKKKKKTFLLRSFPLQSPSL